MANNKKKNNTNKLSVIKRKLKRGEITSIAERTGFHPTYVSRVLNGERNNTAIVATAETLTKGRR